MIRLFKTYMSRVRPLLVAVVVFQAAQAVLTLYLPRISADIIDNGVVTGDTGYIWTHGGWMLVVALAQMICMGIGIYFAAKVSMAVGREIRRDLFHQVTGFSAREVGTYGAPTLITRVTNDVQQVQVAALMTCTQAVMAPIIAIVGLVMALREDLVLAWVLVVAIPFFAMMVGLLMSRIHPWMMAMQDRLDGINHVLREQVTGLRVVRAFVREPAERRRFEEANESLTTAALSAGRLMAGLFPLIIFVQNAAGVAIVWFGAHRIADGQMTVGSLVAFLGYIVQVLMGVMMAMFLFVMLPRAAVSARRINEVLDTPASVLPPDVPVSQFETVGSLELRGVAFGYPEAQEPVLRDVSFSTSRGQTTAIVGSTGAGKTSLINLVARLVDVTEGAVLIDGVDIRDFEPQALSDRIGLIPQRPYLFSGTIASNLRYGKPDATEEEIWEALRVAQAADFVEAMPGGLDAPIRQGGTNVSGGQRQRLAIARALVRKPEIYLFDDSFSALDLATDARLREALVPYTADSTVVIVAQRISTIMTADQIVVLEDGRCVGLGSHRELLDTCPTYIEIVESQLSVEEAA